ncbi:MAG: sulfotransferase [Pelagimonas sp.]|uniref:sulfotransferase n=1 Tax=Pelagimonas sp. TaxID=2073170 RepID=UPI003D6A340D
MKGSSSTQDLLANLGEALELLEEYDGGALTARDLAEPLPSLLDQCAALTDALPAQAPLRSLHHMACCGGTLIAKCLSVMPNVTMLSEMDPLSQIGLPRPGVVPPFRPWDLIFAGRASPRGISDEVACRIFVAGLREMQVALAETGQHLCLRDHAHSQFCTRSDPMARPTLRDMMTEVAPVRSVVTVRHPLDAFLSLSQNAWVHFSPDTLDEYAKRYMLFLEAHAGLAIHRYEDFVADPEAELEQICDVLELAYQPGAETLLPIVSLSGDSGRSGSHIAPRPRRPVPEPLMQEARESAQFAALCDRLGYDGV